MNTRTWNVNADFLGGKCESAGIANGNGTKVYSRILETHNPIIPPAVNMTIPILLYLSQLRKVVWMIDQSYLSQKFLIDSDYT